MNRREALCSLLAGLAGAGSKVEVIPSEPAPLAFVLTLPEDWNWVTERDIERIRYNFESHWRGPGKSPTLYVLLHGMTLEAVVDPRERQASP